MKDESGSKAAFSLSNDAFEVIGSPVYRSRTP